MNQRKNNPDKNLLKIALLLGMSLSAGVACKKANIEESTVSVASVDPVEVSVESGITMLGGIADDQTSSGYAVLEKSQSGVSPIWNILLGPQAIADNCLRAYQSTCNLGLKSASYDACNPTGTNLSISGQVQLSYSHSSCTMTTIGDSVVRSYSLNISGPRGGVLSHSSDLATDYKGSSYGGGGKMTLVSGGWSLEILGRHTDLNIRNLKVMSLSTRTVSPVSVTGSLSRVSRVMDGGQIEVNHNFAKFTTTMVPQNLRWTANCCHPTSGSLGLTFSGSKTGSATVTFQGCGSAQVDRDGQSSLIELSYCE